ncbi:YihY/virulence factor BrkB family protein [Halohasta litorea]|uniref:YihY/virulence factor BrkB family protein n=1 Tax=Halohasta litorea TaxID=869891 RepID=A0ABD6DB04_9EURY|nr:YihY/virulence factor BrkB family protein [Halohasta litorea]
MMTSTRSRLATAKAVVETAREQQITFLAASVAYYAFVSLLPALLLLLVLASTIGGEAFADRIVGATQEFLTPAGEDAITGALADAPGRGGATVVGVGVLGWSTLKVFRALDTAFLTVYGQIESASFVGQLKDATVALVGIGTGVGVMIAAGAVLAALPLGPAGQLVSILALPAVLTVAFLPIYHRFPNPPIPFREALPGAVFAGVGWTLLQAGFQIYAAGAGQYEAYGVVGGILLLVTWLYLAAVIVILGAVVNAVRAEKTVSRPPFPPEADGGNGPTAAAADRQLQQGGGHESRHMAREGSEASTDVDAEETSVGEEPSRTEPQGAPDISEIDERIDQLRAEFDAFEGDVRERTVDKPSVESELKRYVRSRMRRGHARGWGPYLVLLYGVALTLGAFYYLQSDWVAILAMLIIFLSTLGLYVIFVVVGVGLNLLGVPGKAIDMARDRRN